MAHDPHHVLGGVVAPMRFPVATEEALERLGVGSPTQVAPGVAQLHLVTDHTVIVWAVLVWPVLVWRHDRVDR